MKKGLRICFIGDSFVNGTGDEKALGWAGRLCDLIGQKSIDFTYYNLGIRGNTSRDVLARLDNELSLRFGKSDDERVVLSFGVNDTLLKSDKLPRVQPEESVENLEKIIQYLQAKHSLLMVGPLPVDDAEQNHRIETINAAYKLKAAELDMPFIDVYSELLNNKVYRDEIKLKDGAHPSSVGYVAITRVILDSGKWWF